MHDKTLTFSLLLLLAACGAEDLTSYAPGSAGVRQPTPEELFSPRFTEVVLEIDYATGAEPFTGEVGRVQDPWMLSESNLAHIFARKTVEVPSELAAMGVLDDVTGSEFTAEQILEISRAHRDRPNTGSTATFHALWLPGLFHDGESARDNVLGVSIGNTGVIAMFAPVIASTGGGDLPALPAFVEQTTLVHELGHAIGLVDLGLPAASAHGDADHPGHCGNDDCVMYWANEGMADLVPFVRTYVQSESALLFDADCMADVAAAITP